MVKVEMEKKEWMSVIRSRTNIIHCTVSCEWLPSDPRSLPAGHRTGPAGHDHHRPLDEAMAHRAWKQVCSWYFTYFVHMLFKKVLAKKSQSPPNRGAGYPAIVIPNNNNNNDKRGFVERPFP